MPKLVQETVTLSEKAAAEAKKSGRMLVQFISPGWGSSGYYSPDVLEQAATDQVIPAGTHMYADHPTDAEDAERPVRSIKDLMAITTEDAHLAEDGALVGEVQVVPQWRDLVETVKDSIGVSIRGSATDIVEGEADGRRGGIIEGLVAPVMSVDFVTRAGRGGKVLQLLESARASKRAVRRGISEATVNDTRDALQNLLRDAHGDDSGDRPHIYVWVRDFDDTTVWFEVDGDGDDSGLYAQTYAQDADGAVALTGDRTEVRVVTTYVPANTRSDGTTAKESKEDTMPKIQIEEAAHTDLVEKAGRVDALVTENADLKAKNTALEEAAAKRDRDEAARTIIGSRAQEAGVAFTEREVKGFLADITVKEDGSFDQEAFTKLVDEDAAAKKAAGGAGQVLGFGGQPGGDTGQYVSEADFDAAFTQKGA